MKKIDEPKIYVASLYDYNAGKLVGKWLDLSRYRDGRSVMKDINKFLSDVTRKAKDGEIREEYAIHDFEGFPKNMYSEYMGEKEFDDVIEYYNTIESLDIPQDVVDSFINNESYRNIPDAVEGLQERFQGEFDSISDFVWNLIDEGVFIPNPDYNQLIMSDTDIRVLAGDAADDRVENMDNEDVLIKTGMNDEYNAEIESGDDRKAEKILSDAKQELIYSIYKDVKRELEDDPVEYFVNNFGYREEDIPKLALENKIPFMVDEQRCWDATLTYDYDEYYSSETHKYYMFDNQ